MQLSELKINPKNPQIFGDLSKLKKSIEEFPKMMVIRPMVYDPSTMEVLGGNKRLICLQQMQFKEIPDAWTLSAANLTKEEKRRFILADNIQFGEWDFEMLETEFSDIDIEELGIEVPNMEVDDIEQVESFNEFVNFSIVCDNIEQFEELQSKFNVSSQKISYKDFLLKIGL